MRVCLSVLGAAKTERGYKTRWKSFCSAMIGACAKGTALMKRPENNFRLRDRRKFNLLTDPFVKNSHILVGIYFIYLKKRVSPNLKIF